MVSERLDVVQMILNAGLMVKFVMSLLLLFSISSWAIILIKYFQIRRAYKESAFFVEYFWKTRNFTEVFTKAKELEFCPIARVFRIAYQELKKMPDDSGAKHENRSLLFEESMKGFENVKRALHRSINTESVRLIQLIPFLATAGNIAPFIGLFGTVWGIMTSFHSIAYKKGVASIAAVAPGISEALVATAAGLAVAIPAVIAFNYFTQKVRIIEAELDSFSADLLNIIERDLVLSREATK